MIKNIIGQDILLMRKRYDEALTLQGIPCTYQYPNLAGSSVQGDPVIDSYSEEIETSIFFEGSPKASTFKRYGWVVENNKDLPFLLHCSFNLPNVQKDAIFRIAGQYTGLPNRTFRVTELSHDMQAPDHLTAQVVPVYDDNIVGRTNVEIKKEFNKSHNFLVPHYDYRGNIHETKEDT